MIENNHSDKASSKRMRHATDCLIFSLEIDRLYENIAILFMDDIGETEDMSIYIHACLCQTKQMKMKSIYLQLNDLPVEILLIIFSKLHNAKLLHSLLDVNHRLNQILFHPILISRLDLLEFLSIDFISPLRYPVLRRFYIEILPKIHDQIKWLNLESLSIRRVLLAADYSNLNGLGLYNLKMEEAEKLFSGKIFKDEVFSKTNKRFEEK